METFYFKNLSIFVFVFLAWVFPGLADRGLVSSYIEMLELNSLQEVRGNDVELALRLIEGHSDKVVAYQVEIKKQEGVLVGRMTVISKFRQDGSKIVVNSRELSREETSRIISVVNRREILFLPEMFRCAVELTAERGPLYSLELHSTKLNISKTIVRSFSESDCLEELRDWLVSIAHIKSENWIIERK